MKQILKNRARSVSVVTVCLNTRDTIRLTMESVARQTLPDVRHVIIDGGSKDGTLDIIREYDPTYLTSEQDKGIYDAMDKGAQAANGDLLIFLNAGDTFFDDAVCEKVAAFAEKTRADIVFGDLLPVRISQSDHSDHGAFEEGKTLGLGYMRNRKFLYNESIHHQTTFYRRWIFDECAYLCEKEHASGEYNLLLDAVQNHGAKVKYIPQSISRFALGGTSTHNFEKEWEKYSKARETLRELYMPDFEAIKVKSEAEFHTSATAAPIATAIRRARLSIRKGPVFGLYSRFANGIASRTTNMHSPELRQVVSMEVRAALAEIIAQFEASEDRHVKKLTAVEEEQHKRLCSLETSIQKTLGKSIEKVGRGVNMQKNILTSLEASIQETINEAIDKAGRDIDERNDNLISLEASIQDSLNASLSKATRDIIASNATPGRARHEVLVQHGVKKLDAVLDKTALNIARLAEVAGMFDRDFGSGSSAYSQWDEDGILQYLIRNLPIEKKFFVEFGVGDYSEANTRLLLVKDDWAGLVIDSDVDKLTMLRNSELSWRYPLSIREAMVEPDNINDILVEENVAGEIGLLSVDIDGMDYWVWDAIEAIKPTIVVCEYNSLWGGDRALTVPYERGFDRTTKHFSWIYAGASISALRLLGEQKGYVLVGVNDGGNNAFFVRKEIVNGSEISNSPSAFRTAKFREARDEHGALTFASSADALEGLEMLELYDVELGELINIQDLGLS